MTELSNLSKIIANNNIRPPAIVIIGKIVDFKVNNNLTKLSQVNLQT